MNPTNNPLQELRSFSIVKGESEIVLRMGELNGKEGTFTESQDQYWDDETSRLSDILIDITDENRVSTMARIKYFNFVTSLNVCAPEFDSPVICIKSMLHYDLYKRGVQKIEG